MPDRKHPKRWHALEEVEEVAVTQFATGFQVSPAPVTEGAKLYSDNVKNRKQDLQKAASFLR